MVYTRRGPDEIAREVARLAPLFLRQAGGHVLTLLDPSGMVLSYNEEGERAECWPLDRVLGQPHDLFYPPDEIAAGRPGADLAAALLRDVSPADRKSTRLNSRH